MADTFLQRAFNFFVSKGYSPNAAAALAGNMQHESGGNPTILGDKGTSQGLYQWHDTAPGVGRKTDLYNWAAKNGMDPEAEQTQLEFAHHELTGPEKAAGDKIKAAQTYKEAQDAAMGFGRGLGYDPKNPSAMIGYASRYNYGAPLVGEAQIPDPQSPFINGPGPGGQGGAMVAATNPADVFTGPVAPDVTAGPMPAAATTKPRNLLAMNNVNSAAQGLLAQGQPQATWTPQALPLLQVNRGQPVPFPTFPRGLLG